MLCAPLRDTQTYDANEAEGGEYTLAPAAGTDPGTAVNEQADCLSAAAKYLAF